MLRFQTILKKVSSNVAESKFISKCFSAKCAGKDRTSGVEKLLSDNAMMCPDCGYVLVKIRKERAGKRILHVGRRVDPSR